MKAKDTLWRINWGDGDNAYIVAPDIETAKERMAASKEMVNYVVKLDYIYQEIFNAGMAKCAETHFKPDWEIKAQDVKDASEEGFKAGIKEDRKEVGEWLAGITVSGNAVANELLIVEGIANLKRGEMPEIKEVKHD